MTNLFTISLSLSLSLSLSFSEFFSSNYSLSSTIQTTLKVLQSDTDRDVCYFSGAPLDPPPMKSRSDPFPSTKRTRSVSEGDSENDGYKFDIASKNKILIQPISIKQCL